MRISYLSPSILPSQHANAIHVMKMAQAFAHNGHQVALYAAPSQFEPAMQGDIYDLYNVAQNFSIKFIKRRGVGPFWNAFYAMDILRQMALEQKPDIIYGRHLYAVMAAACRYRSVPVIYEAHILPEKRYQRRFEKALFGQKNFYRLVVISAVLKQDYLARFPTLDAGKIIVAHDGADPVSAARKKCDLPGRPHALRVCYAGRLIDGKGAGLLASLIPLCPDMDFHIFGGAQSEVKAFQRRIDNAANAFCHGHISHAALLDYYPCMDVMLAPLQPVMALDKGRHDVGRWTSPLKIFEYMAAGKPIICSDLPVLREVLKDGNNALLCAADRPEQWVCALRRLQQEKELGGYIATRARADFLDHYTWQARAKGVISGLSDPSPSPRS